MLRATKTHLELEVTEINAILERMGSNQELRIGYAHGQPMIELFMDGRMEKYFSPRLPKPQMYDWLGAFHRGLVMCPPKALDTEEMEVWKSYMLTANGKHTMMQFLRLMIDSRL